MAETLARTPNQTSPTRSRSVTETVNGSHRFVIQGYSLAKGMGVGKHIASEEFTVGGYKWAIYFYPDGRTPRITQPMSRCSLRWRARVLMCGALRAHAHGSERERKHKVHSHFDRSLESGPYTLKYPVACVTLVALPRGFRLGANWFRGYKRFFRRAMLETSDFLRDDCLKINCTVGVVVSATDCSMLHSIQVPESDIGEEVMVPDMEPKVFKALLHFIYLDTLAEDELIASSSYSVAQVLSLADCYHAAELKDVCLKFAAENLAVAIHFIVVVHKMLWHL
ncbi:hypothetical protein SASPL_156194 [Salvia splendens]|uniref:MATH domain-containing protein n=1 Tax=Salvia splendens TaxID=180675 RepID=A0A8X8VX61_SALSN|nr:hypothetical protein SASPL_156194 [Salvia splendens]